MKERVQAVNIRKERLFWRRRKIRDDAFEKFRFAHSGSQHGPTFTLADSQDQEKNLDYCICSFDRTARVKTRVNIPFLQVVELFSVGEKLTRRTAASTTDRFDSRSMIVDRES